MSLFYVFTLKSFKVKIMVQEASFTRDLLSNAYKYKINLRFVFLSFAT